MKGEIKENRTKEREEKRKERKVDMRYCKRKKIEEL